MVVKGKTRGHGSQLASYLLSMGENERVNLVYVDGQARVNAQDFRRLLGDFSLTEKLTRSRKGIYHASINPPEEFSRKMSKDDWLQAAGILAKELGFSNQRMAVVLHQKLGREHIHCIWERYNHENGKILPVSHNYEKHLRAGREMAQVFSLRPLSNRNPRRDPMKETLTRLWTETPDAKTFIQQAKQHGYWLSRSQEKRPYRVHDDTGRSFNLVGHLKGIKTKEVRERFKGIVLMDEREAVAFVRNQQAITENKKAPEDKARIDFLEALKQTRTKQQTHKPRIR